MRRAAIAIGLALACVASRAAADEVARIAPSSEGRLGAWLVVGPFRSSTFALKKKPNGAAALDAAPEGVDEAKLAPKKGAFVTPDWTAPPPPDPPPKKPVPDPTWTIASSNEGTIDLKLLLHANENDVVAYVAGTLHVARAGRYALLVTADDGVRVTVDGRPVLTRDEARPARDDDDRVALDLGAGDHAILFKLHQRDGGWRFNVRLVDDSLRPPEGAWIALPGSNRDDARALAQKLSWVSLDRGVGGDGYRAQLTVKFLEGAPLGVPLAMRVTLARLGKTTDPPLFDVEAGDVPVAIGESVVSLPPIVGADAAKIDDADWAYAVDVAGRALSLPFTPRRATREAIVHADRALAALETPSPAWLHEGSAESVAYLRERLAHLADHGDADLDAQKLDAKELDDAAAALDARADPYERRTGPMRRAYRSPVDDALHEFGLYVPPSYRPGAKRKWPLVVALHGLNGKPMAMLRHFFGGDRKEKDTEWEDRHWSTKDDGDDLPTLDAFVVTPEGHGNAMYRDLGEDDVMRVLDWAKRNYPIDLDRVSITGPSMGGIGTAAIAFRHPDVFSSAAPLCGYHSYFVRRDVMGRPMRPWERLLAEERSNVEWAENGEHLPLWIVHGTQDLPEANSGVLIERYEQLGYDVKHEHPNLGHNVWQTTYEEMKGADWLVAHARVAHPRHVRFRTVRLRDGDDAWIHVTALAAPDAWGEVDATVRSRAQIAITTRGVRELHVDRDAQLVDPTAPVTIAIDGARLAFDANETIALHRDGAAWTKGDAPRLPLEKRGEITGPIRDAFHAPLLFVYGADDPAQTAANEEVARAWAMIRWGTVVKYPVMSDAEFFARGESLANDHALFLVGNARSNRVVRALEPDLPIAIDGNAFTLGAARITGSQLGAAFVHPNPKRPDRYVVVVEGIDALGTWRSLSLPDLIPDFVVWDESVAPSRGQVLLGPGAVRAAGFFGNDWSLPAKFDDPLAAAARPAAKTEYEATPYLP